MKVRITAKADLNLIKAKTIAEAASRSHADVRLLFGDKSANAKSLMGVVSLSYKKGSDIVIHAEGKDAEKAIESLRALI